MVDIITIVIGILSGLNDGYAVSNMPIEIVRKYAEITNFDPENPLIVSLLEASMCVGAAVGCALTSLYLDKLGLIKSLIMLFIINFFDNILQAIPVHWVYLVVTRTISGLAASSISSIAPLLLAVLLNPHMRGRAVMIFTVMMNVGIMLAYVLNLCLSFDYELWWFMFIFSVIVSVIAIVLLFLLKKLTRKIKIEAISDEDELEPNLDAEVSETVSTSIVDKFNHEPMTKKQRSRLLYITISLGAMQMLTGIDAICVYASKIFQNLMAGEAKSGIYGSLILGGTNMIGSLVVAPFAERKPRKTMLMIGVLGSGICNLVLGLLYQFKVNEYVCLVLILLNYISFNLGPEPIVFMLFSELFPRRYKYKLNSLGYTVNWIACIITVFMMDFFLEGQEIYVYWFYGITTLIFGISGIILSPETLDRSLHDIECEIRTWGLTKEEKFLQVEQQKQLLEEHTSKPKKTKKAFKKKSLSTDVPHSKYAKKFVSTLEFNKFKNEADIVQNEQSSQKQYKSDNIE